MVKKLLIKLDKQFKHSTTRNRLIYNIYSKNFFLRFFFHFSRTQTQKVKG